MSLAANPAAASPTTCSWLGGEQVCSSCLALFARLPTLGVAWSSSGVVHQPAEEAEFDCSRSSSSSLAGSSGLRVVGRLRNCNAQREPLRCSNMHVRSDEGQEREWARPEESKGNFLGRRKVGRKVIRGRGAMMGRVSDCFCIVCVII